MISIGVHAYIIYILVWTFFLLFREGRGCGHLFGRDVLGRIRSVRGLQFTDCSYFLLLWFPESVETSAIINSLRVYRQLVFLDYMRVIVKQVHVCGTIKKIGIYLNIGSLIAWFLSEGLRLPLRWLLILVGLNGVSIIFWGLLGFDDALLTQIRLLRLQVTPVGLNSADIRISPSWLVVSMRLGMFARGCWLNGGLSDSLPKVLILRHHQVTYFLSSGHHQVILWRARTSRTLDLINYIIVVLRINHKVALWSVRCSWMNFPTHKQNILGLSCAIRSQMLILNSLLHREDILQDKLLLSTFFSWGGDALLV